MNIDSFLVNVVVNRTTLFSTLLDKGYLYYAAISEEKRKKQRLLQITISSKELKGAAGFIAESTINYVTYFTIKIDGFE